MSWKDAEFSSKGFKKNTAVKITQIVVHGVSQAVRHPKQLIVFNHVREPEKPDKQSPLPWQAAIGVFFFSVAIMCVANIFDWSDVAELMKVTASLSFGYLFGLGTGVLHK